jgi:hypothetical protein
MRFVRSYLLCLLVVLSTSCATITRGSHEKLRVLSEPLGATVVLSSGEKGVTPAKFVKSRWDNFAVTVSKAGYIPQTVNVESKVSAAGGDATAGTPIVRRLMRKAVNAVGGTYNSLYPNPVLVRLVLREKSAASSARAPTAAPRKVQVLPTPFDSNAIIP